MLEDYIEIGNDDVIVVMTHYDVILFSWVPHNSGDSHPVSNNEIVRKRMYRIGLNLFNKKPEKGLGKVI